MGRIMVGQGTGKVGKAEQVYRGMKQGSDDVVQVE